VRFKDQADNIQCLASDPAAEGGDRSSQSSLVKGQWSNDELRQMAEFEVELEQLKVRFMNKELEKKVTWRTLEAIKG
jgi:hypothetical protein